MVASEVCIYQQDEVESERSLEVPVGRVRPDVDSWAGIVRTYVKEIRGVILYMSIDSIGVP